MQDSTPDLSRGIEAVEVQTSVLNSTSKYLNHSRLRDWLSTICLRRNGHDLPPQAELPEMMAILAELRDHARIEVLFTEERRLNPELDAWFAEGFLSSPSVIEDYRVHPDGSLGGDFYRRFKGQFEVEIAAHQWQPATTQFEFFRRRQIQNHDFEHIICGGGIDALGELVPSWFRMTNVPRFIQKSGTGGRAFGDQPACVAPVHRADDAPLPASLDSLHRCDRPRHRWRTCVGCPVYETGRTGAPSAPGGRRAPPSACETSSSSIRSRPVISGPVRWRSRRNRCAPVFTEPFALQLDVARRRRGG